MPASYSNILQKLLNQCTNPKLGLVRMENLINQLKLPDHGQKIIQVVGTNGKGSTVAFIESVLIANGYTTGLFTSPHLCCARERIRINGHMISEDSFVKAALHIFEKIKDLDDQPSFFECMLGMALWLFAESKVQVAILESGLGGRLDATTATKPDILGISSIDLDHQHILGSSLEEITREKIAAARAGQQVISVEQKSEVSNEIIQEQKNIGFFLSWAPLCEAPLGLLGPHQKINAGLALKLIDMVGLKTSKKSNALGLLRVMWPGRFEIINQASPIILDGAHNTSGVKALCQALKADTRFAAADPIVVFGSLRGPNTLDKIIELLKNLNPRHVFVHAPKNPRALSPDELTQVFLDQGYSSEKIANFSSWPEVLKRAALFKTYVLVCGSLYTVGEARGALLDIPMDGVTPNF